MRAPSPPSPALQLLALCGAASCSDPIPVWPIPQQLRASGAPLPVARTFRFRVADAAAGVLARAAARYEGYVAANATAAAGLESCSVGARSYDDALTRRTSYNYTVTVAQGACAIEGDSVYGAVYGMETLSQLAAGGALGHSSYNVSDGPAYEHRGMMLDTGRRFWPLPLVRNVVDTMSFGKMNVLHLHLSDMCRFGVESRLFPELTANLSAAGRAGHYTQDEVRELIAYARDRGVRVVPEFDMPGHAAGLLPMAGRGVGFCNPPPSPSANWCSLDAGNGTAAWRLMPSLVAEMHALFGGELYHMGGDEAKCHHVSLAPFERMLLGAVAAAGATPIAWTEVLTKSGAATNDTIIQTWLKKPSASQLASQGRAAIEACQNYFYLSGGASGPWLTPAWRDIGPNHGGRVLGGEAAMWTDQYVFPNDCVRPGSPNVTAWRMFDRAQDDAFARSATGMLWPRGHLAAGSFWNFRGDVAGAAVVERAMRQHNALAARRGALVCPTGCTCNQTAACGVPYLED